MKLHMPDGTSVEAERVDFKPLEENWNIYKLEDGTIIKTKTIVGVIFKLESIDPLTGQHHYYLRHNTVVDAKEPAQE